MDKITALQKDLKAFHTVLNRDVKALTKQSCDVFVFLIKRIDNLPGKSGYKTGPGESKRFTR